MLGFGLEFSALRYYQPRERGTTMREAEKVVNDCRKVWNGLTPEHRRVLARWICLDPVARKYACDTICHDGNCKKLSGEYDNL